MSNATNKYAVVITSIAAPNDVIKAIASTCQNDLQKKFFVIGDTKSPSDFSQPGCDFYSIEKQLGMGFSLAANLPTRHYARKNLGYLQAWKEGFDVIVETDDEGEVVTAELHGPRFNDRTVHKLTGCNGIPIIKICNTGLSRRGNKRLRELLPNSIVRRNLIKFQSHFYGLDHPRCGRMGPVAC